MQRICLHLFVISVFFMSSTGCFSLGLATTQFNLPAVESNSGGSSFGGGIYFTMPVSDKNAVSLIYNQAYYEYPYQYGWHTVYTIEQGLSFLRTSQRYPLVNKDSKLCFYHGIGASLFDFEINLSGPERKIHTGGLHYTLGLMQDNSVFAYGMQARAIYVPSFSIPEGTADMSHLDVSLKLIPREPIVSAYFGYMLFALSLITIVAYDNDGVIY